MYNALIALALGLAVSAILTLTHLLSPYEASLPGFLVLVVAYIYLARRTFGQMEGILRQSAAVLQRQPPQIDRATAIMREAYPLGRWQFGVRTQIDAQLGMLLFLTRDFKNAQPLLARAYLLSPWLAGAMLAVIQYKQKDPPGMRKTMNVVTRKAKKQGLAWNLYAYMLNQLGDKEAAMRVLAEGAKHTLDDARVKESLLALQNGKKMKMRAYREQWYQFHLERPPIVRQESQAMGRGMRQAQRGRW